jgi:hypothetical protein
MCFHSITVKAYVNIFMNAYVIYIMYGFNNIIGDGFI